MSITEVNLDGLVGPTHNYAGLSYGNIASERFGGSVSNPKKAALQGLAKMKFMQTLGLTQMVMPPQPRPDRQVLARLGFKHIADVTPALLAPLYSASSMWAANAATVSASADTADGKVHFTPANMVSNFHRSLEAHTTSHYLKQLFPGDLFVHHAPLPEQALFSDEGAANHMRLKTAHTEKGVNIFVHGAATQIYPARQTIASQEAIARLHGLASESTLFLRQNAKVIDEGVFHNDVIAMSNDRLLIHHELAYETLDSRLSDFKVVAIREKQLTVKDAVKTYFFNSQVVTLPDGTVVVVAPKECEEHAKAQACFKRLLDEGIVAAVHYLDVRESMKNGGGPACLRLRVPLSVAERNAVHSPAVLSDDLYNALCKWIEKHYRDKVVPDDLRDPTLATESQTALAELSQLLKIKINV